MFHIETLTDRLKLEKEYEHFKKMKYSIIDHLEPLHVILEVICFPIARVWGGKRHYACSTMSILSTEDRAALSTGSREERHEGPVSTQPGGQATLCLGPTQHLPSQQHHQQVVTLSLLRRSGGW